MENKKNPLSPHIQIYRWHISSLLSITHRIVGIVNFICIISLTFLLIFSDSNYQLFQIFFQSFLGKFFIVALCWSFSFQILNEFRHLAWDMGYAVREAPHAYVVCYGVFQLWISDMRSMRHWTSLSVSRSQVIREE